jgi:hypothetical protein
VFLMADQVTRNAARWATIVTVPVVLLVGVLVFGALGGFSRANGSAASPSASHPTPAASASGPVTMDAPKLSSRQAVVCRALLSQLPDHIGDLAERAVTAGSEQNAAYGNPAITLSCGGAIPSYAPTDTVYPLNGACWLAVQQPGGTAWTTLDREVPVTVTVPSSYDPPGQRVIDFSGPVVSAVPAAAKIPYGCR